MLTEQDLDHVLKQYGFSVPLDPVELSRCGNVRSDGSKWQIAALLLEIYHLRNSPARTKALPRSEPLEVEEEVNWPGERPGKLPGSEELTLENEKYRFWLQAPVGVLCCDRHGHAWRRFTGDKAVLALFHECLTLRKENNALRG